MPLLGTSDAPKSALEEWRNVLQKCLASRIDPSRTTKLFNDLHKRAPLSSSDLASVVLGFRAPRMLPEDPRLLCYVSEFLDADMLSNASLLLALLKDSPLLKPNNGAQSAADGLATPTLEERMFHLLITSHTAKRSQKGHSLSEVGINLAFALTRWMKAASDVETTNSLESEGLHTLNAARYNAYDALAMLTVCIFGDAQFRDVQKQSWWKTKRALVRSALEGFSINVGQWVQSQSVANLQALLNLPPFIETDGKGLPRMTDEQIRDSTGDLPMASTRGSLYIWLNASLCARPLTDDVTMMQQLHARSNGNMQSVVIDLLVAAFDNLSNAMISRESRHQVKLIKSFICNRIPVLLATVSSTLLPMTAEQCVQMSFTTINMDPLPPLTNGANDIREALKLTRMDFLQACALHGLVSEATIGSILQTPITLPRVTKHTREGLTAQCAHNTGKLESLIDDLEGMQGNAGAISGCIVDTLNNYSNSKDTMSLKSTCMALIKKIPNIDIIMQYFQPTDLLLPLCNVLNNWVHEQDQSELQPPYEEFATILLLLLAVVHRYQLTKADLGLLDNESIVTKLMQDRASSVPVPDLPEDQKSRLGKWIEGLYTTDESGETSGITDEVMSQCPPQSFYLLVPTLFEQTVLGCKSKALPIKTMKGGLEFLLEPFLLPSLVGGLGWLIKHSWEDHGDADILLAILDKLLRPPSSSSDTQAMHKVILGIVGMPLEHSLEQFQRRVPSKKEVEGLLKILRNHTGRAETHARTLSARRSEFDEWCATPEGGLQRRIKNDIKAIVDWLTGVGPNPPPKFTFKSCAAAVGLLGPAAVLQAISEEVADQTNLGKGAEALDVATSLISAPDTGNAGSTKLQEMLHLLTVDAQSLLDKPAASAEALVRLQRRVDAQHAMILAASTALPITTQDSATDQIMQDLGLTAGTADVSTNVAVGDQTQSTDAAFNDSDFNAALNQPMDLGAVSGDVNAVGNNQTDLTDDPFAGLGLDSGGQDSLGGVGAQSIGQQTQDEDIFAGLDMDFGDDYTFT